MLLDALKYLVAMGRESAAVQKVPLPGGKTLLVHRDGVEVLNDNRITADDQVDTLVDLVEWIAAYGVAEETTVLIGDVFVTAISNRFEGHERDKAIMVLRVSDAMKTLLSWGQKTQAETVKALRGPLAGSCPPGVLGIFRRLDFQRNNAGGKSIGHTGESLGKSIEAKAQSLGGEIPEEIKFTVPVYEFEGSPMAEVLMAVTVNAATERIELDPVGDTFIQAEQSARAEIKRWLLAQERMELLTVLRGAERC